MDTRAILATAVVAVVTLAATPTRAGLSGYLREQPQAAPAGAVPVLRVLDGDGQLRWQLPVGLWGTPKLEFGGCYYPGAVSTEATFRVEGPLVFVGYGLTREDWDDYQGERIDGAIAVVFMGEPVLDPEVERVNASDAETWEKLVQEKVDNAKAQGAVAVLLERNPLTPACEGGKPQVITDLPIGPPSSRNWRAERLAVPTLSMGSKLLEVVVSQTSDLFGEHVTLVDRSLADLVADAEKRAIGLGPISLGLRGEVSWQGGHLEHHATGRCDLWYQPGSPAARDLQLLATAAQDTVRNLESLLSARFEDRITILLFADWRSKLVCTGHTGWGAAGGNRMAMVYEGDGGESTSTLAHELCHLVAGTVGRPPACLDEGLAVIVGDTLGDLAQVRSGRLAAEEATVAFLEQGELWSLPELLKLPEIGPIESRSEVAYPEAASFCAYLIREIGFDGFRTLYATLDRSDFAGNVALIEEACGASLTEIEADWHAKLHPGAVG